MDSISIIKQLTTFENRIGRAEADVCKYLCRVLESLGIDFSIQKSASWTPQFNNASLKADGKKVKCLPCGLVSGEINDSANLISSLTSSQNFINTANINFNPKSDAICLCNFYFAPALAISRQDATKIMKAKKIEGRLEVTKRKYTARNILIGNTKNPKNIIFAHYDAYFKGAIDNASGVGVVVELISKNPGLLDQNLFVLAGNEELSYDYPVYWGRGFREFKRENPGLLEQSKSIYVVDCVGDIRPSLICEPKLAKLAFPIGNFPKILSKTNIISGDFDSLMKVYHGPDDQIGLLKKRYLDATNRLLRNLLA